MTTIQAKPVHEVAGGPQSYPWAATVINVAQPTRIKYLRFALQLVGLIFVFGIYTLSIVWPSGWVWHTGHTSHYLPMILGVYATLGVFLLIASRNPLANLSLIWFTVWSSIVHAAIMAVQALANPDQIGHLWGDVPALLIVAAVLALLTPRHMAATVTENK
jgi:MFS superfamily sulfate permease-like transporter